MVFADVVDELFTGSPTNPDCNPQEWFITEESNTVKLDDSHTTATLMKQSSRSSLLGQMHINLFESPNEGDKVTIFAVRLRLGQVVISSKHALVRVHVGCFNLTSLTTAFKTWTASDNKATYH
jgi:hypothetical protein